MRKQFCSLALVFVLALPAAAGDVALVFPGSQAVLDGKAVLGTFTGGGVVVSLKDIGDAREFLAGVVDGVLQKASLVRMDNELQVALLKFTGPVEDANLAAAFQAQSRAVGDFLPRPLDGSAAVAGQSAASAPAVPKVPYVIKIDDQNAGDAPVRLKVDGKRSTCKLEVIKGPGKPSWRVIVRLESSPALGFWNSKEQRGLNSVPAKKIVFRHQALFSPFSEDSSIVFPLDVSSIKDSNYTWTIRIEARENNKDVKFEKSFPVVFEPK